MRAQGRQISEWVLIEQTRMKAKMLNSKNEWHGLTIPRIVVEGKEDEKNGEIVKGERKRTRDPGPRGGSKKAKREPEAMAIVAATKAADPKISQEIVQAKAEPVPRSDHNPNVDVKVIDATESGDCIRAIEVKANDDDIIHSSNNFKSLDIRYKNIKSYFSSNNNQTLPRSNGTADPKNGRIENKVRDRKKKGKSEEKH